MTDGLSDQLIFNSAKISEMFAETIDDYSKLDNLATYFRCKSCNKTFKLSVVAVSYVHCVVTQHNKFLMEISFLSR